jgi:hypothetical protein
MATINRGGDLAQMLKVSLGSFRGKQRFEAFEQLCPSGRFQARSIIRVVELRQETADDIFTSRLLVACFYAACVLLRYYHKDDSNHGSTWCGHCSGLVVENGILLAETDSWQEEASALVIRQRQRNQLPTNRRVLPGTHNLLLPTTFSLPFDRTRSWQVGRRGAIPVSSITCPLLGSASPSAANCGETASSGRTGFPALQLKSPS